MAREDNIEIQIQEYLDGNLSGPELSAFEQLMQNDHNLAAEVKSLRQMEHNLRGLGYQELKSEVSQWESDYKTRSKKSQRHTYLAIAASLAIFTLVGYFAFYTSVDTNDLYAIYYSPYPDMIISRGEVTGSEQQLTFGMQAYNDKNYVAASTLIEGYLAQGGSNKSAYLYLAISQLETGSFDKAEGNFKIAAEDPNFVQQSDWYRALLYLKQDRLELARTTLKEIAGNDNHYKHKDAESLLNRFK
jgi:hypothetical protein